MAQTFRAIAIRQEVPVCLFDTEHPVGIGNDRLKGGLIKFEIDSSAARTLGFSGSKCLKELARPRQSG